MNTETETETMNSALPLGTVSLHVELTASEQAQLKELEGVIKKFEAAIARGRALGLEAAGALEKIRDLRLYRGRYGTFEEYCREVWGYSKAHINRQIGAGHVVEVLTPIGATVETESVARPLVGLKDDQIVTAYQDAQKLAGNKPVTAKLVRQAAAKFKPEPPCKPTAKKTATVKPINLEPALELLAFVEQAVKNGDSEGLAGQLAGLRACLEALAGKPATDESAGFDQNRVGTGTKEWSDTSKNCAVDKTVEAHPRRVQLSRKKRMVSIPPNTIFVNEPLQFGYPFKVTKKYPLAQAVADYEKWLHGDGIEELRAAKIKLKGKNLGCYCELGTPCHADVLLRLVNA